MQSLFTLAPLLANDSLCLATTDSVFDEAEFTDFINYSRLQKDVDGTLAVTRYIKDAEPLCVALDDDDTILKFSDSKEGYSWAAGGLFFLSPKIFDEMQYALDAGIDKLRNYFRLLIAHGYLLKGFSFSKLIDINHIYGTEEQNLF